MSRRARDPRRLYRVTLRLGFTALGLIGASLGFGALAVVFRAFVIVDDPGRFCIANVPPEVSLPRGEGPTGVSYYPTPLPFGLVCHYLEEPEVQVFHDTGTPLVVAALLCAVIALILLVVWAVLYRRLAPMWRRNADVEETSS